MTDNTYDDWVKYPTGKIGKGEWCEACARYNNRNVTCTAMGVRDEKVLLVLRATDPQKGYWCLPGGYLDWDETIEECASREFSEETGLKAKSLRLLGVYSDPDRDLDGRQNVDCCFVVEVEGDRVDSDDEIADVKWFGLNDLPDNIAFDHGRMIEDYNSRAEKFKFDK